MLHMPNEAIIVLAVGIGVFCLLVGCLLLWTLRRQNVTLSICCSQSTIPKAADEIPNAPDSYEPMSGNTSFVSNKSKFRTLLSSLKQIPDDSIDEVYETMQI